MNTSVKFLLGAIAIASLAACGGGGGSSTTAASSSSGTSTTTTTTTTPSTSTASGTPPAPTAAPTATLAATQAEADKLAAEVKAGLSAANAASASSNLPRAVETASLPVGIVQDVSAYICKSGTASIDVPSSLPAAGYKMTGTYNNCSLTAGGFTLSGTYTVEYTRYTGPTDFALKSTYTNFTMTGTGLPTQSYNGSVTCDFKGTTTDYASACYYSDGSRAWSGSVTYSGNAATGTYAANYGSATIKVSYSKFGTAGGTATVTGANGYSAVITWDSATSYTVKITANGVTSTYTSKV